MDFNIKEELIDEINQLSIKNEPAAEVEARCSTSKLFAVYDCSVMAQNTAYASHFAQLDIDYNIQVTITDAGIRVGNHAFADFYAHGLHPRTYLSSPGNHCTIVVVQNVISQELGMVGQLIDPAIYNLRLTFKNVRQCQGFCQELEQNRYRCMN